ncbi:MAG: 2-dehydro-3-deoxy-6-phosphogalactonate aldolase [Acuticoccus sp.]
MLLGDALLKMPLVAILRGMPPQEAQGVGKALADAGVTIMEVPLNSPDPFTSIRLLADAHGDSAIVGAGTVLRAEDVARVADAGGRIIVSPNFDAEVVKATKRCGLISLPGVLTPTEAFAALDAGADAIKLFPGDLLSPKVVKAMRAVLPPEAMLVVTGGVSIDNIGEWLTGGSTGVGIGSALYRAGKPAGDVAADAMRFAEKAVAALAGRAA